MVLAMARRMSALSITGGAGGGAAEGVGRFAGEGSGLLWPDRKRLELGVCRRPMSFQYVSDPVLRSWWLLRLFKAFWLGVHPPPRFVVMGAFVAVRAGGGSSRRLERVKVYRLKDNGKWDDQGTGHVTIDYIEGSRELVLAVVDEEDNDTLLLHKITPDDIYRKQEETIISWRDPEKPLELALSFQEAEGCSYIWENMSNIREDLQSKILRSHAAGPKPSLKSLVPSRGSLLHDKSLSSVNAELKELPPLELSSLSAILKTILQCGMEEKMRVTDLISKDRDFFPKIVNLFKTCKDTGDMDGLHMIFRLVKAIILLNSSAIFDKILSDDFILDIIGVLEYDPEVHIVQRHRAFLKDHAVLKKAIPIKNDSVVSKIHQTYRIHYIKDVILRKVLDDATLKSLNTIIHANNAFVVSFLKDDPYFIQDLFEKMRSNISAGSKSEPVKLVFDDIARFF